MSRRVAYLVGRYPLVTQTFIVREVEALRALGWEVDTYTVRATPPGEVLSTGDRAARATTVALLPPSPLALLGAAGTALRHGAAAAAITRDALSRAAGGWRASLWQLFYVAEALLLHRRLRGRAPRHVHVHFANMAADVARLATRFGNRVDGGGWSWSFTMHGPTEFADVTRFDLAGKVADATRVVCIGDFCRSQLQALVDAEHWDRLTVVHCGIDPEAFPPVERPPLEGRPARLLALGQLVGRKGQRILLDAAAELTRRGLDVEVVLAGDGPDRQPLEKRAAELGLADRTTFTGAVSQDGILDLYRSADVFCLPSFAEGVPVVLMEAMATGLPSVSTRVNGIPELVVDGVTGRLVAPGRADELADVLAELLTDAPQRERLARDGRAHVLEHYELHRSATALSAVLAELT